MTAVLPAGPVRTPRRGYLDWLRGLAVLIMIEAHTLDAWTLAAERTRQAYSWGIILGGFGAPVFLLLAGIALALAAGSRTRRGLTQEEVAARARRRGLEIFGLAFLFRLQSWLISGGDPLTLLKVDILNVMGLAMLATAIVWGAAGSTRRRAVLFAGLTITLAMLTPLVRASALVSFLPDPIEWYLRPVEGRTTFTLFPWAGFLVAGAAIGLWLDAARTPDAERRANVALAAIGVVLALGGYWASFLPPLYEQASFWTSSPTFFFLRLGVVIAIIPLAYAWNALWKGWSPIRELGVASLFVYWIHVEMVYGVASSVLHRRLTLEQVAAACVLFATFLFGLVKLKDRIQAWWQTGPPGAGRRAAGADVSHLTAARRTSG